MASLSDVLAAFAAAPLSSSMRKALALRPVLVALGGSVGISAPLKDYDGINAVIRDHLGDGSCAKAHKLLAHE